MKKIFLISTIAILLTGCYKDDIQPTSEVVIDNLKIQNSVGLKLESPFVKSEVSMNVKLENDGQVTIKIFDIGNRVVSKETVNVKAGNNILKVYTSALPSSAYRIALFDANGKELGIADFNKL